MKTKWRPYGLTGVMLVLLLGALAPVVASPAPVQVQAVVDGGAVRLEVRAASPFDYTSYRPSETLFVVDLAGVSVSEIGTAQVLRSDVVSSYRLLPYNANGKAMARLEVLLREPVEPKLDRSSQNELVITFASAHVAAVAAPAASIVPVSVSSPSPKPAPKPAPTTAKPAASAAPAEENSIDLVQVVRSGEQTQVRVAGSGKLDYHVLRLSDPPRLVLDFTAARMEASQPHSTTNIPPVRGVRLGQYTPDTARVVIELDRTLPYTINTSSGVVTVGFGPSKDAKLASARAITPQSPAPKPVVPTPKPAVPAAKPPASAAQQPISTTTPAQPSLQLASMNLSLPANLTESSAALASPAPAPQSAVPAPAAPSSASAESPAAATPQPAATQPAASQPAASEPVAKPSAEAPQGAKKYTGEPISVNLKDVDLKDFFRLIHEISGLNVVLDPNVKGSLTLVLDDVPWDQALEIVLHNNDLDKQLEGNVLRVATNETLKREAEQSRELAKAQAEAAETVTTTRVLSYAKASDLKDVLKKFLSPRGDILSDDRSNTLIIRDLPSVLPVMDNLIRQLDRKSQQVEIEARVVAANRSFSRDIGTQFAFAGVTPNGRNFFTGDPNVGTSPISRPGTSPPPPPPVIASGGATPSTGAVSMPLATNLGSAAPTSGVSYSFASKNFSLDFIISAAEAKGIGKLLSKPKVITQNNQRASVKQGTKIPIQTTINNTISVQYIDAVLRLEVTPQITAEGTIYMDVIVENTQIDPSIPRINGIPALDTQMAETKVLVNDGGTVVIGGVIISSQRNDVNQVPLFGSIPAIGNLFKHTTVSTQSQELLFFLTPRILPS